VLREDGERTAVCDLGRISPRLSEPNVNEHAMPKTRQRIVRDMAKVLAVVVVATMDTRSFDLPESVMQGLRILHVLAMYGLVLLSILLAAWWIAALFARTRQRDPSDQGTE
jgi:hypothetical protein